MIHNTYSLDLPYGGEIITRFKCFTLGFKTLHGKETIDIELITNYREVGFRFYNGKQSCTINACWRMWQPNIGFGSTMGLVVLFVVFSRLCVVCEGDFQNNEGMVSFGFTTLLFVCCLLWISNFSSIESFRGCG